MIPKKRLTLLLTAAILCGEVGVTRAQLNSPISKAAETQLIEVLKSGATYKEKVDACHALARGGSKDAVPTLATLLGDEKLNHMARYALEQIPDAVAESTLRAALGKLQGLPLIGVISSVGSRRDIQAIAPLTKLLNSEEAGVADAAAHSLGRIGTVASGNALRAALSKPTPALYDGVLRCAETLPRKDAAALYDAIRKPPAPQPIRMAALRGAILSRQEQGLPLVLEALRGTDYAMTLSAIESARELPGAAVTKALAAEIGKLPADRQILLVQVLGDRGDAAAVPQLVATARKSQGELRATAVKSIVQIGGVATLPFLAEMAATDDVAVVREARAGLAGFAGVAVEAPITAMLKSTNPKARAVASELVAQRRMTSVLPQLLVGANDANPTVANANIRAIGEIGGNAEAPALIKILMSGASTAESERALSTIYARNRDATVATALLAALPKAPTVAKLSLMRVLRRVGGPEALSAIRTAMTDPNAEVRDTAMRSVGEWPTVEAMPDLMTMAKTPPNPTIKVLALRGLLRLIPLQTVAPDQKLASVREVLALVERPEEKRLVLTALGGIPTAESLALVVPELANPQMKGEASVAAVAIGEQLVPSQPAIVGEAMALVSKATTDRQLLRRVQAVTALAASSPRGVQKQLFNGKDLAGWEGLTQLWSVQDGAIVGKTTTEKPADGNTFLVWKDGDKFGEVSDFELTLKYKILDKDGDSKGGGNSGIQYRSKILDPKKWVVGGYQADFEVGKSYSGILYEEQGRGILAQRGQKVVIREGDAPNKPKLETVGEVGVSADIQAAIKPGDWNEYKIIARGNRLQHFINGKATVDVTDETAIGAKSGVLALQLHAGPPMTVQFKDIVLTQLP